MTAVEMLVKIINHIHWLRYTAPVTTVAQIPQLHTIIINSLQLSSSDQSPQLSYPSHWNAATTHSPVLRHLNWSAGHATHTRVCHMRIKLQSNAGKNIIPRFRGDKKYKYIFKWNIRKQFYQTALGKCYGLKLLKCWLQFKEEYLYVLCRLL